jgi:hypothetical protein
MPVAGVGQHDLRDRGDADVGELGLCRGDHRFEVAEVRRVDGDVGRDHDLLGRDDGLRGCSPAPSRARS